MSSWYYTNINYAFIVYEVIIKHNYGKYMPKKSNEAMIVIY